MRKQQSVVKHGLEKIASIKKEEEQAILLKTQLKVLAPLNQTTIQLQKYYDQALKLKRQENLFIGISYGKQEGKHCIKELEEDYEVIEKSISNYTETNNKIILLGNFNGIIGKDENGITNGDTPITTNGKRISQW